MRVDMNTVLAIAIMMPASIQSDGWPTACDRQPPLRIRRRRHDGSDEHRRILFGLGLLSGTLAASRLRGRLVGSLDLIRVATGTSWVARGQLADVTVVRRALGRRRLVRNVLNVLADGAHELLHLIRKALELVIHLGSHCLDLLLHQVLCLLQGRRHRDGDVRRRHRGGVKRRRRAVGGSNGGVRHRMPRRRPERRGRNSSKVGKLHRRNGRGGGGGGERSWHNRGRRHTRQGLKRHRTDLVQREHVAVLVSHRDRTHIRAAPTKNVDQLVATGDRIDGQLRVHSRRIQRHRGPGRLHHARRWAENEKALVAIVEHKGSNEIPNGFRSGGVVRHQHLEDLRNVHNDVNVLAWRARRCPGLQAAGSRASVGRLVESREIH